VSLCANHSVVINCVEKISTRLRGCFDIRDLGACSIAIGPLPHLTEDQA
jgi:hypothetical protein